ncbi:MAG: ATP-binding protein [Actinobacteria bacterium]|nr:ATP-binding protein [Actinomycetota bacterium]
MDSLSTEELASRLAAAQRVWGRLMLEREQERWRTRHAEFFVGQPPPGFTGRRWVYEDFAFVEGRTRGLQISRLLRGQSIRLGGLLSKMSPLNTSATTQRLWSQRDYGGQRLPWPAIRYEVSQQQLAQASHGFDLLVGTDCPSFSSYERAFSAFFRPTGPYRWEQNASVVVSVAQTTAFIERIVIGKSALTVHVAGEKPYGVTVQMTSGGECSTRRVGRRRLARFGLSKMPGDEMLIALIRGGDWLDYRLVSAHPNPREADPTIVWDDPRLQLEALLFAGEGQDIEYKACLPKSANDKSRRTALKTVPAFANAAGGTILFGVDDEAAQIVGLDGLTAEEVEHALSHMVRSLVHPAPDFRVECNYLDGKLVAALVVAGGPEGLYVLFPSKPEYYVRRGATTFPATREEVIELAVATRAATDDPFRGR